MPLLRQSRTGELGSGPLVTRRRFLQAAAVTTGAVAFSGCGAGPNAFRLQSQAQLAEDSVSADEAWYATACAECSAGCGVLVRVVEGRARKIEGNPDHPVNLGKLCARAHGALQEEYNPDRIRGPLSRTGSDGSTPQGGLSWDEALRTLARQLDSARGRTAVISRPLNGYQAMLLGQFTNSLQAQWLRLETVNEEPFRSAVRRVFGIDGLPEFDVANANYVLSFGADFLGGWLSPVRYSLAYGRFRQGSYRAGDFHPQGRPRGHLVQIEPRFSGTAAAADEWVPVHPGTEGLVALGIAQVLGGGQVSYAALDQYTPEAVAPKTGVAADQIRKMADEFRSRGPSLALGGGAAGAHTNGTEALAAILGLNLLVANVGKAGGVQFNGSIPALPQRTPPAALADWTRLVSQLLDGSIDTVLVLDANPVYELPAALGFGAALKQAKFAASFTGFPDETADLSHMVLPPHLPLEDWGTAPSESSPLLTIRQPILEPLYDSRSMWDSVLALGRQLNLADWPAGSSQDVLRGAIQSLPGTDAGTGANAERFWTGVRSKGFLQLAATSAPTVSSTGSLVLPEAQFAGDASQYPYYLQVFEHNSLGSGRQANLPWMQALPDPITSIVWETWVEVSPKLGFKEGDIVRVETPQGTAELPAYVNPAASSDTISIPLGQGHGHYGRYAQGRGINTIDLLAPVADNTTGSLAHAATRARLVRTGRRVQLSKFEGDVPAYQIPGKEVLQVRYGAS